MTQQSTSWNLLKGNKISNLKRHVHSCVYHSIVYNSQNMETTECSSRNEWIKKCYICKMKYYLGIKRKILPFARTWVDLQSIMLSEIGQRQILNDFTKKTNEENCIGS